MQGHLVLEDGSVFSGKAFGCQGKRIGEVVFNTSMTGYQQIFTDPSYCGQIITMTYPLIGNYGINPEDMEASRSFAQGIIVHDLCTKPNNWRATNTLENFLIDQGLIGLSGLDTRALTIHLRQFGSLRGIIAAGEYDSQELLVELQQAKNVDQSFVSRVSTSKPYTLPGGPCHLVVIDFGSKQNIIRWFNQKGCTITVVPYNTSAEEILAYEPQGVILSNGPGDPQNVQEVTENILGLFGRVPVLGVCLGHQLLGLALGGKTFKLHFGHRGGNHPVQDVQTRKVFMTSQNHGYALEKESLPTDEVEVSHISLFDETVEGLRHKKLPVFSVQFHPEAAPGPLDSAYIFQQFLDMVLS
ncbi:glutamine-hydrolyzing carbamoyl-phosphate synthase small subunit [Bacillota bacterium LX-D]|nr:glutamine-hydrolyzing carbamoyl-phosphate synthase small subunit [Bacillota bacterium LX-D]